MSGSNWSLLRSYLCVCCSLVVDYCEWCLQFEKIISSLDKNWISLSQRQCLLWGFSVSSYYTAQQLQCVCGHLSLFLGSGHPGAGLKCVCCAAGVLADLLLPETSGGCMTFSQSPRRSRHQPFFILLRLQGQIFLLHLLGLQLDLRPVRLILHQLLWNTKVDMHVFTLGF